ncbi:hypothetical protein GM658_13480 [Pseudoduganella eburnea]|uniref:HEAT repeat domain-containing protein n=1 Tax=Massilia eburnea TaxID=1776165 RepID=A0A6L6QHI4_9BURK|nr:hypothetical protein [Massilia eburnea]MTW11611.1 hypothetical protein [Massilia eburnea]
MSIESIKRRARDGTLEVEHLLKDAIHPNDALAMALDALSAEMQWPFASALDTGDRQVPLATWAKVVSTYCRDGFNGLIHLAGEPKLANFVIGLLEEIKKKESFDALLLAFKENVSNPCCDVDTSYRIAGAVNQMLSFKPIVEAAPHQAIELRAFLCALYACSGSEAQRATALLALRAIGDESSAEFAASKSLDSPWHEVPKIVSKHIRKRLLTAQA